MVVEPFQVDPLVGYRDVSGVLAADQVDEWVKTDTADLLVRSNRATAFFYETPGKKPYLNGGSVMLDTLNILMDADNTYGLNSYDKPFSFTNTSVVTWRVDGNVFVKFPAFTVTLQNFPGMPLLDVSVNFVTNTEKFTLRTARNVTDADYMIFAIRSDSLDLYAKLPAGSNYYTFPDFDMARLKKGEVTLEIAAVKETRKTEMGKTFAAVNRSVTRKKITIY